MNEACSICVTLQSGVVVSDTDEQERWPAYLSTTSYLPGACRRYVSIISQLELLKLL